MRAVYFDAFGQTPVIAEVADPVASSDGVVVRVQTTGLCRSDIHGWQGHDAGIALPHVPGHELVGIIDSVGDNVSRFAVGQRVTTPFVCACGHCPECLSGNGQVCRNQTQPGFTHWGSYAELVALHSADQNLIAVPDEVDGGAAALLGCRFATAYRGVAHRAALATGEWLLVVGCGGVGLSAVMIGKAIGARVIGVDVSEGALQTAARVGADRVINSRDLDQRQVVDAVRTITGGAGANVSVEALGREATVALAIHSLAPRGRHVQIGLLAEDPAIPMSAVIAQELTIHGSHGMPASAYPELLDLVRSGALRPQDVITEHIGLDDVPEAMARMARGELAGVTVIDVEPH